MSNIMAPIGGISKLERLHDYKGSYDLSLFFHSLLTHLGPCHCFWFRKNIDVYEVFHSSD